MIHPVRRELLDVLAELNPNLRLGQTLTNAVFFSRGRTNRNPATSTTTDCWSR